MTQFFSDKIAKIRSKLPVYSQSPISSWFDNQINDAPLLQNFSLVNEDDMQKVLASMKNKENIFDPIPISLVKSNSQFFIPLLTDIVNKSLQKGFFPEDLKHALVSPVHKPAKDDTEDNNA